MKINVYIPKAENGEFSRIKLGTHFGDGQESFVKLNIDYRNLYDFTEQSSGKLFDLFFVSSIVYGVDVLIPREKYSIDGWSRELEVDLPVEDPDLWISLKSDFEQLLNFLTGDVWNITFIKRPDLQIYVPKAHRRIIKSKPDTFQKVSLFSGGLDSLVGVIDQLSRSSDKIVFASHYDAIAKGPFSDQNKVSKKLEQAYSKRFHLIQTRVDLDNVTSNGDKINHENSFRSRSFLFISIALCIANKISQNTSVLIPENGTIALNHPLTPSRRSSCSTRTAHPYYISLLNKIISNLGLTNRLINDYEFMTKGEMLLQCGDKQTLISAFKESCSCAKRGSRKDIRDIREGTNHCGVCMPCLYRRASLHKIGLDDEIYGTNLFQPQTKALLDIQDMPAFLDYLKQPLTLEDIERNLLVNGTLPLGKLKEYAMVVVRTRAELKTWINDKGDNNIKRLAGI